MKQLALIALVAVGLSACATEETNTEINADTTVIAPAPIEPAPMPMDTMMTDSTMMGDTTMVMGDTTAMGN